MPTLGSPSWSCGDTHALIDEATAGAHYQAFNGEIIARLPEHGAIIQRTTVLAWLAGHRGEQNETVTRRAA